MDSVRGWSGSTTIRYGKRREMTVASKKYKSEPVGKINRLA
jgi:hypothetical protein